jgi:methylmalonyl-CoA epimerase
VISSIHHVGIAVEDLEAAVERYRSVLGLEPSHRERVEDQGVEEVLFDVAGGSVQLLGALGPDTPVGRFLATRGPGLHHLAFGVADVADELSRLRDEGARLVDEVPRRGSRGTLIAFLHPQATGGTLVELVQQDR